MNRNWKQSLSALLAALTVLPLAACAKTPVEESNTQAPDTTPAVTTEAETTPDPNLRENAKDNLPADLNLNGASINIMAWAAHSYTKFDLTGSDDVNGDIVFDAIHDRNAAVSERLNCTVNPMLVEVPKWQDVASTIQRTFAAGDDTYSIVLGMGNMTIQWGNDKYFMDVSGLDYLDFDQPWWWKDSMDELSLDGETRRYLVGDMLLSNYQSAGAVYFNKRMFEAAVGASDDLYRLVLDGGWTWDKLREYCEIGAQDVDGDGVYGDGDILGTKLGHGVMLNMMEYSTDVRRISRDDDGYVKLDYDVDRAAAVTEKLYKLIYETKGFAYNASEYTGVEQFAAGKMLFYIERVSRTLAPEMREMQDDYGIIPMAKADDSQKEYTSMVQNAADNLAIPKSCPDPDAAAAVLEALNAESYRSVVEKFYETALKVKYSRDSYSGQCIDLISGAARRFVEYEYGFVWADMGTIISTCVGGKNSDFVSAYTKKAPGVEKLLAKYKENLIKQKAAETEGK